MKGKVLRSMAIFMAGLVVMQGVFSAGNKAKADHAASGKYSTYGPITVIVEDGTQKKSPCYCIERTVLCSSNGKSDTITVDPTKALLYNTIFLFGFNSSNITSVTMTNTEMALSNKTQDAIWAVSDGAIGNAINSNNANNYISLLKNNSNEILKKTGYHMANPSYVDGKEKELVWNETTKQFELTLTNTDVANGYSANNLVKVDNATLPNGVKVVVEGEKLILTSTEEFTTAKSITLYKRVQEKGKLVVWDFASGQDQITLDYDEPSIAKTMELKIKTGKKPVVATPAPTVAPTVAPTQQPTQAPTANVTVAPTQQPLVNNTQVEVKDGDKLQEVSKEALDGQMDNSPKTADSSNMELIWTIFGAACITLVTSVIINKVEKKRNR